MFCRKICGTRAENGRIPLRGLPRLHRRIGADVERHAAGSPGRGRRAWRAVARLTAAGKPAVSYLTRKLAPIPAVDEQRLLQLIADLDSSRFAQRTRAVHELEKLGELAVPALQRTLQRSPSAHQRQLIADLLERLDAPLLSREPLRASRAVAVLEQVPIRESQEQLQRLAQGAEGALLTQDARAALARLRKLAAFDK